MGIISQTAGSTEKLWVNPVDLRFEAHRAAAGGLAPHRILGLAQAGRGARRPTACQQLRELMIYAAQPSLLMHA